MNPWTNVLCTTGRGGWRERKYKQLFCPQVLLEWFTKPLCSIASNGNCSSRWQHAEQSVMLGNLSCEPPDLMALSLLLSWWVLHIPGVCSWQLPTCLVQQWVHGWPHEQNTGVAWGLRACVVEPQGPGALAKAAPLSLCWGWALSSEQLNTAAFLVKHPPGQGGKCVLSASAAFTCVPFTGHFINLCWWGLLGKEHVKIYFITHDWGGPHLNYRITMTVIISSLRSADKSNSNSPPNYTCIIQTELFPYSPLPTYLY